MDIYTEIRKKIREIAGVATLQQPLIFPAEVAEVSGNTCSVKLGDLVITDVRLRAVINTNTEQLLVAPKVGSYVLVADLSDRNYRELAVISYSEVEKINIKIGDTTVIVDGSGVSFNGGQLGGLIKLKELQDNLDSLKQYVEAINNALPQAFSAVGVSTAANGSLGATSYQGAMAGKTVQIKAMEDTKITH